MNDMSRYQALRTIGCDPLTAAFIAFVNWLRGYPPNRIVFLTMEIDLDGAEAPDGAKR